MNPAATASESLVGREEALARVRALLGDDVIGGGAALLLGDPGAGKTAVLGRIAADAEGEGARVLWASGVRFESDVSHSGLHQLLFGIHESFGVLDPEHRDALRTALSFSTGPAPSRMLVCNATLLLVRAMAAHRPLLLVVDDLPWVDRASAAVLGFVSRRLAGSQVGFLGAARSGTAGFFEAAGLPRHELGPVDDGSAWEIVGRRFPGLAPSVRRRVVAEAAGNPLALLELPEALTGDQRRAAAQLPAVLPLTERLESLFAERVSRVPPAGREMLLLGALDRNGGRDAMRAAGESCLDLLAPAERERLVQLAPDSRHFTFRHPLIRSAVVGVSTTAERQRAHRALAEALSGHPEQRAWHLGEAAAGPDEEVAALLERSARLANSRGDAAGAIVRLNRAAALSPEPSGRARRLALAAYLGAESVGEAGADLFLEEAERTGGAPLLAVTASAALLINGDGDVPTAHGLLASAIETGDHGYDGRDDALTRSMHTLLLLTRYAGTAEALERYLALFDRLKPPVDPDLELLTRIFADTADPDPAVIADLSAQLARLHREADPNRVVRIGSAVQYLDRLGTVRNDLWRVVRQGRAGAAPTRRQITALAMLGRELFHAGRWDAVAEIADEGDRLCAERGFPFPRWIFRSQRGLIAAARGEDGSINDELVRWAMARQAGGVEMFARHGLALHHIGQADFEAAYREATSIAPPGSLPGHLPQALWVALDLVEAAVRTGRQAEAVAHAAVLRGAGATRLSSRLGLIAAGATALVAEDDEVRAAFGRALSSPDAARWPFDQARVRLAFGERLRRMGAVGEARAELLGAADVLRRLGAVPWSKRTENELRATGLSRPRANGLPPALTAREREIAELAAAGLTNKEIGKRLHLSHRTVGSHLYQLFPKLGLRGRAGLRDALLALTEPAAADRLSSGS
ncbi:ATP-binding protein [Streptosporangium sp. H16]|uniref:ATP-binding protein n=1 Tax=Streptosporangium sp. H16 TaxID=3444184 RepID=UPI003F792C20